MGQERAEFRLLRLSNRLTSQDLEFASGLEKHMSLATYMKFIQMIQISMISKAGLGNLPEQAFSQDLWCFLLLVPRHNQEVSRVKMEIFFSKVMNLFFKGQ